MRLLVSGKPRFAATIRTGPVRNVGSSNTVCGAVWVAAGN